MGIIRLDNGRLDSKYHETQKLIPMSNIFFLYYRQGLEQPLQVTMKLVVDTLYLADYGSTDNNHLSIPLKKCHYVLSDNNALVYFGNSEEEYVVVPNSSSFFIPVISLIDRRKKDVVGTVFNKKVFLPVGGLIGIIVLIYVVFSKLVPTIALKCISRRQEISIGNNLYKSFVEEAEIDTARSIVAQQFANKLHLSTDYPIRVTVLKDTIVNAFAFPGGHLVIYTGILDKIEKPEELVALLAHESSHVNNRHNLKEILSNLSTSFLITLVTQGGGGVSKVIIGNANNLQLLSYSRDLERDADNEGMKLMVSNGINPIGMKWLMEDLRKLNEEVPSSISFLSNHPMTDERIKNATDFSNRYKFMKAPLDEKEFLLWQEVKR